MKPVYGVVVQPGTARQDKKTGWRIYRPRHKQEECIGCRECERLCPDGAIYRIDRRKFDADMDACKGCGICAEMCPVDDIDMVLESEAGSEQVPGPQVKGKAVERADEGFGGGIDSAERKDARPPEGGQEDGGEP
jgi:pyruvate ferredoxin oxidoreductase delta subunit